MSLIPYYFSLYKFFTSHTFVVVRAFILILLIAFIAFSESTKMQEILVGILMIFFIQEIFIRFKLKRILPEKKLSETTENFVEAMLFSARHDYFSGFDGYTLAKRILSTSEGKFFAEKVGPSFQLQKVPITREQLLTKVAEVLKSTSAQYISRVDLLGAYVSLSENTTKFLAQHDLTSRDIERIAYWTRHTFHVDNPSRHDLVFQGIGFGESFVYGWHYEIKKYATDMTAQVLVDKNTPVVVGRQKEYDRLVATLTKKSGSNVLLIGETGTGKTALIEYFSYNSHIGNVPKEASRKKVYAVHVDRILAGVQNQGELAERLELLFSDLEHSGNALLFIPNIENIFGGGGFNFDVSGVLYDYIKNNKVSIIGSTTPSDFKTHLENKSSIISLFEVIRLDEPSQEEALLMIFEKVANLQEKYMIHFTYGAVQKAVELSSSYVPDSYLPGKAIQLLEDVASSVKILKKNLVTEKEIIGRIEEKTNVLLATPSEEERALLLHLEDSMREQVIDQEEAVTAIANAMRRVRGGFKNTKRPIAAFLFLGPTGVGKTESARVLSKMYFKDEKRLIRLDMSEYQTPESIKRLLGSLPGEEAVSSKFLDELREHPFSLILLDEFEKSYPKILDIFLQVFEEGVLTDNRGRKVSFVNTIIIATSNAGSDLIREKIVAGQTVEQFKPLVMEYLQKEHILRPELLNRFDDVVMFTPLSKEAIKKVAALLLRQSFETLSQQQIHFTYDESVITKIISEGYSNEFGARNIRRYIQNTIESYISKLLLEGKLAKGEEKILSVADDGSFLVR